METLPAERLAEVRARIRAAAERVGRDPATVRLIGASKTVEAARLETKHHGPCRRPAPVLH